MKLITRFSDGTLAVKLEGEIDEHSVIDIRRRADEAIEAHAFADRAIFYLGGVSFMDSTGIGFLIGRYKKLRRFGIRAYISGPDPTADKILTMSGVYTLIPKINDEEDRL
ncbi:MAG: anti-sigma factor antagonist [Clostridia bacterium]|nr:anti-sigma factor antagonist [Clostridia bacterium]